MSVNGERLRARGGLLRRSARGAAILAAVAAVIVVARLVLVPWAYPLPGRPALTGHWQGRVAYAPGDTRVVMLSLHRNEDCSMACDMDGTITVCGKGKAAHGDVTGDVRNPWGSRFSLGISLPHAGGGTVLTALDGDWHGDTITGRPRTEVYDPDGTWDSAHQIADPAPFLLRHTTREESDAGC